MDEELGAATASGWGVRVVPLLDQVIGVVRRPLVVLQLSMFLVLLVACVNVSNVLLARGLSRTNEMAVMMALGAGRVRIARRVLAETLAIAGIGGAVGLAVAAASVRVIARITATIFPGAAPAALDPRVVAFTVGLAIATALIAGVLPALRMSATDPGSILSGAGPRRTHDRNLNGYIDRILAEVRGMPSSTRRTRHSPGTRPPTPRARLASAGPDSPARDRFPVYVETGRAWTTASCSRC